MSVKQKLVILKLIMDSKEFRPIVNDKNWSKMNSYYIIKSLKEYRINEDLMKLMTKFTQIYRTIDNKEKDNTKVKYRDKIASIYFIKNIKNNECHIGYTISPFDVFIKFSLHLKNLGYDNLFNKFSDTNPLNFRFRLLEFIKYKTRDNIYERKNYYKKKFYSKKCNY